MSLEFDSSLTGVLNEIQATMTVRHEKYGPLNISKHGLVGVRVRLDDKLARIDNGSEDFADESYRDAWVDVAGYALIALMLLDNTWPSV